MSQVENFTESSTFKVRNGDNRQPPIVLTLCKLQHGIVPKVKAALLGPNIWAYVKGIGEFIVVGFFFLCTHKSTETAMAGHEDY